MFDHVIGTIASFGLDNWATPAIAAVIALWIAIEVIAVRHRRAKARSS